MPLPIYHKVMLVTPQASWLGNTTLIAARCLSHLLKLFDTCRTWILRRTLRVPLLRKIYIERSLRLFFGFTFFTLCYFPAALYRPDLLLVFGPLLLGYPHLIASYRYVQAKDVSTNEGKFHWIHFFALMTLAALALKFLFQKLKLLPDLPYGAWEIIAVATALSLLTVVTKAFNWKALLLCLVLNLTLLKLAWWEPLIFVASILIVHNWVAFAFWVAAAKGFQEKLSALGATLIFGVLHYFVFTGVFDVWMPMTISEALHSANLEATSWALAPWSRDPTVWRRALTLYTYGLSMHYFVWLKAVPESLNKHSLPNSFKSSFELLRNDLGSKTTFGLVAISALGIFIWIFSFSLGAAIYFALASLHGWLELSCLAIKVFPTNIANQS